MVDTLMSTAAIAGGMATPAQASELVAGAQVAMSATKQADGSLSASRITIAKAGAQLPY